jgi:tetratricopeptide (TPR) repeat protein
MMSEIAKTLINFPKVHTKLFILALSVTALLLVYGLGIIVLPMSILYGYQNKNCELAFSLNSVYTILYPGFIQDGTTHGPVSECTAYTSAISYEEAENWQDAYDSYQVYSSTYPNGLYANEAYEHSAVVLLSLTRNQIDQKTYPEVLTNLNLIVADFSEAGASAEAWTLFPSVYTSWGTSLREASDFEKSEQVFSEFKTWSQNNQKTDLEADAHRELTQTYLDWGVALQSQKQFESALAKLDLAEAASSQSADSLVQVKAGQSGVYIEWGNDLLEQGEYSAAIERFNLAIAKSDGSDNARDALANGHIRWANSLSAEEDFLAALEQLETAEESAFTEEVKQSVETAFGETYLAFSNSTGTQARVAIKEAFELVCNRNKKLTLPIFGLNREVVRVGISGADDVLLPENLAAGTPGEMHYIACIEEESETVDSRSQRSIVLRTSRGYYYTIVDQFRAKIIWNIKLLKTDTLDTLESVAEKTFTGGTPPPFPATAEGTYFYGPPPTIEELTEWLESVIGE